MQTVYAEYTSWQQKEVFQTRNKMGTVWHMWRLVPPVSNVQDKQTTVNLDFVFTPKKNNYYISDEGERNKTITNSCTSVPPKRVSCTRRDRRTTMQIFWLSKPLYLPVVLWEWEEQFIIINVCYKSSVVFWSYNKTVHII